MSAYTIASLNVSFIFINLSPANSIFPKKIKKNVQLTNENVPYVYIINID